MNLISRSRSQDFSFAVRSAYPRRHKGVYVMGIFFLALLLVGYITVHSSSFFTAPALVVSEPVDGARVHNQSTIIRGTTEPKSVMRVNGYETYSDEQGNFELMLPFQQGYQTLDIRSKNRIGREARVVRHIVVE